MIETIEEKLYDRLFSIMQTCHSCYLPCCCNVMTCCLLLENLMPLLPISTTFGPTLVWRFSDHHHHLFICLLYVFVGFTRAVDSPNCILYSYAYNSLNYNSPTCDYVCFSCVISRLLCVSGLAI